MSAWQLRLIGTAAMVDAIRETGVHLIAAEVKIGLTGMPHRPATDTIVKIEQAGFVRDFGAGPCRHKPARRGGRDGCLLVAGSLAQEAAGANRNDSLHRLRYRRICARFSRNIAEFGCWRSSARCRGRRWRRGRTWRHSHFWLGRGWRCGLCNLGRRCRSGRRFSGFVVRLHRGRTGFQPQTVGFADNGITADTAKLFGDLACGRSAFPHFRQLFDALFGPAHAFKRPSCGGAIPDRFLQSGQSPVGNSCHWSARTIPHRSWPFKRRPKMGSPPTKRATAPPDLSLHQDSRYFAASTGWGCGLSI